MPRRFQHRSRRGGRPLRGMDWDYANFEVGNTTSQIGVRQGLSQWVVLPSDVRARYVDPTLMAIRAFVTMFPQNSPPAPIFGGMGIIKWSDNNDIPPSGADMPDPIRDGDLDWIARWVGSLPSGVPSNTAMNPNVFDLTHLSKAKRRLGNDTGVLACFSGLNNSGAGTSILYMADVRALLKE